ncbi:MAG: hypothetical protein J6Q13_04040 [Clostridia bacterium]|nr:hypothetical protein [Clostridia bacterium]
MNINPQTNLTNIRNFLQLIYWEENASQEEVYNFLQECVTYVFNQYGIDRNKFDIGIHFVDKSVLGDSTARMIRDEKYENKFYILLNKTHKSFKVTNKNFNSKYYMNMIKKEESFTTPGDEDVSNFYFFIIGTMHEIGHIIQYIRNKNAMYLSDKSMEDFEESMQLIKYLMPNSKQKRAILKNLEIHADALEFMSPIEKDADKKAYIYFVSILQDLINIEENEEMLEHYYNLYDFIQSIRKDYFISYRKHNIRNRTAIISLNDLNFTEVLEELSNNN